MKRAMLLVVVVAFWVGCDSSEEGSGPSAPVTIEAGDECHVCGMIITNFPGPKGEAFVRGADEPFKYCSTRDLFSHLLQPEMAAAVTKVYVHDMASTDWEHPADSAFIDAREAWYVIDHPLKGAMGPTLASFAEEADAEQFAERYEGRILRFDDITLKLVADLPDR